MLGFLSKDSSPRIYSIFIDGQVVMENRHIPGAPAITGLLAQAQHDWTGRTASAVLPDAFPWRQTL